MAEPTKEATEAPDLKDFSDSRPETPVSETPTPAATTAAGTTKEEQTTTPSSSSAKKNGKPYKYTSSNAAVASAAAQNSTSRTKTFTGCWTCRARKIKCDLRRPTCFRCEKGNLQCAGYSIKLRWSPSNAKGETNEVAPAPASGEEDFFQRRNVEFVTYPPHMVYEYYEDMDVILSKLHSPKIIDDETKVLGPFGVFQGVKNAKRRMNRKNKRQKLSVTDSKGIKKNSPATNEPSPLSNNSPSSQTSPMPVFGLSGSPLNPDRTPHQEPVPEIQLDQVPNIDAFLNDQRNSNNNNNNTTSSNLVNSTLADDNIDDALLENNLNDTNNLVDNGMPDSSMTDSHFIMDNLPQMNGNMSDSEFNNHIFQSNELLNSLDGDMFHMDMLAGTSSNDHDVLADLHVNGNDQLHQDLPDNSAQQSQTEQQQQNANTDINTDANAELMMPLNGPTDQNFLSQDFNLGGPANSQFQQPQSRLLLNYYIKNVARVMTVVAHEKTAWKTIYFPRAISAIGEIVGLGTCSNPRRALLHAILSISSYHLASKLPNGSDQKTHYTRLGASLKHQALQSLHECLQSEPLTSLKHKDIMTAMLSMVTIDVVSGEMKECRLHLQGCKHLVTKRRQSGRRISKKALVLHRISSFLCLLQDSTTLNPTLMDDSVIDHRKWDDFFEISELGLGSPDSYTRTFNNGGNMERFLEDEQNKSSPDTAPDALESLSYIQSESQLREYWNQYSKSAAPVETFYDSEPVSTFAMYCIPDSLTLLFSRTVKLTRQICYMRWKKLRISKATVEKCNLLQKSLQEWGQWYNESRLPKEFTGDVRVAIDLHTHAFYQSLLIYHYTNVREINPSSLQGFVSTVLDRLNKLLSLNHDKSNPLIIPLLFPAFIAACEALTPETQQAFEDFFNKLVVQGLGTYFQARLVVKEVWKRRAENNPRASWRHVLQDENVNIMLS